MYKQLFLSSSFFLYKPIILEFKNKYRGVIALDFDNSINEKEPINPCNFSAPIVKYVGDYAKSEEKIYLDLLNALNEYSLKYPICAIDEPDDSMDTPTKYKVIEQPRITFPFDTNRAVSFPKSEYPTIESVKQVTYKKLKNRTTYVGAPLYHTIKYKLLAGIAANNIYETPFEFIGYW